MTWQPLESRGYHQQHGAFVRPGTRPHRGWCTSKHYRDWLEWESEQLEAERLAERQERFEGPVEPMTRPEPVEEEPEPPDLWVDRLAISWRLDDDPELQQRPGETWQAACERQQEALNLTACAEAFRKWIDLGCPITKGKT